ncbi:MAG TPA: hypothetical protein VHE37_01265 [Nevskiaceae bacterium]|nr:hypothetical protein [Nevskiaceae bacterium]
MHEQFRVLHMQCHGCGINFDRPLRWFRDHAECPFCGIDIAQAVSAMLGARPAPAPSRPRQPRIMR